MSDEENLLNTTIRPSAPEAGGADPRDDWLSDASELDWFPGGEERQTHATVRPRVMRGRRVRRGSTSEHALQQRRLVAVAVLLAVVVVAVIVVVLSSTGGSPSTTPPVSTTQPPVTQPTGGTTTSPGKKTGSTTPRTPSVTVDLPKGTTLKSGDKGAGVATLQRALTRLGTASLKADGKFGPATQQAVISFQTQHSLTADGVVGSKTAQAINTALAGLGG
jgi:Putative peptidoglycan binding domain